MQQVLKRYRQKTDRPTVGTRQQRFGSAGRATSAVVSMLCAVDDQEPRWAITTMKPSTMGPSVPVTATSTAALSNQPDKKGKGQAAVLVVVSCLVLQIDHFLYAIVCDLSLGPHEALPLIGAAVKEAAVHLHKSPRHLMHCRKLTCLKLPRRFLPGCFPPKWFLPR
jgi:hypothetical protein